MKKRDKINYPSHTFDNRNEDEVMLQFSQEDFLRQSHVNLSDYSFGYPSDEGDKENRMSKSQLGGKTKSIPRNKSTLLKSHKAVSIFGEFNLIESSSAM